MINIKAKKDLIILGIATIVVLNTISFIASTRIDAFSEKTLYVGGFGPNNYTNIQDAIDNANNGDTIFVYNGIYRENVIVDKMIDLIGEIKQATIIDGNSNGTAVEICSDGVVMRNFSVRGGGGDDGDEAGICITVDYVVVDNNIIRDNRHAGLSLLSASYCMISDNVLINNRYDGIHITEESHYNTISNNDINSGISGIYVCASNHQLISYNIVTNCSKGIYLTECSGNTVINNHLTGNTEGLFSYYAVDNTIQRNNFILNERNARFAKFFHLGFLAPNKWVQNYWDDWMQIGVKCIFGAMYVRTFSLIGIFVPWVEIDWNPAEEPYTL